MTTNRQESADERQDQATLVPTHRQNLVDRVEEEGLDLSVVDMGTGQVGPDGNSFLNPALVGSGTIMPDGTYGAPLPDPMVKKLAEDPNITTDLKFATEQDKKDAEDSGATGNAKTSVVEPKKAATKSAK